MAGNDNERSSMMESGSTPDETTPDEGNDVEAEAPPKPDGPLQTSGNPQEERLHDPTADDPTIQQGVEDEDEDDSEG
jgi:hypothetical protein